MFGVHSLSFMQTVKIEDYYQLVANLHLQLCANWFFTFNVRSDLKIFDKNQDNIIIFELKVRFPTIQEARNALIIWR